MRVPRDVWNNVSDKAESEGYDKIKMVHNGEGSTAYGVLCRWFADASGFSLAEQARMLMHLTRPSERRIWQNTWKGGRIR